MKKLRKIVSLLLAVVMMMSLLAVQVVATSTGYSITITNSSEDTADYYAYKMLDLSWDGNSAYSYYFTDSSEWKNFFWDSTESQTADGVDDYVVVAYNSADGKYYVTWNNALSDTSTAQEFGQLALTYINSASPGLTTAGSVTSVAGGDSGTINNLDLGYYIVTSSLGSLVELNSNTTSVNITDKNSKPYIDKTVSNSASGTYANGSSASYGDTVYFKVEISEFEDVSDLTLHDALPAGFTFGEVTGIELYLGGTSTTKTADLNSASGDYTVNTSNLCGDCSFEVVFDIFDTYTYASQYTADSVIVVYYTATVNTTGTLATTGSTGNTNSAWLTHSTNAKSGTDTTQTFIYELFIYKYDASSLAALSGAVFTLTDSDGNYVTVTGSTGIYTVTGKVTSASYSSASCDITTDSTGFIHITGLAADTYTLTEITAPTGYSLPSPSTKTFSITVADSGLSGGTTETYGQTQVSAVAVENSTSSSMPTTGGIGTTIFYVVGGVLVIGAVILLITKKRMNGEDK